MSGWSLSLLLIGTGVMLLVVSLLPTHIAGNKLDLVMTDVPDIVDVFVGTPLGTSDRFFVSCMLWVKQSVPEYNIRSTVFLKYRTNWDNVRCAVRSLYLEQHFEVS